MPLAQINVEEKKPPLTQSNVGKKKPPLNQIFYGPPGTGKTYSTTKFALDIIDGVDINSSRNPEEQKERFAELQKQEQEQGQEQGQEKEQEQEQEQGQIAMVTFHQNFAYEDFIEGIKPKLNNEDGNVSYHLEQGLFQKIAKEAEANENKNYVLIIDEINRGNISKILGELITLIEPSKRLKNKDALKIKLPYSKEFFGVPNNLYIIGTMNTADRSLAQLDTALRRRFHFVKMMPKAELLNSDMAGVNLQALLSAINKRIVEIDNREHQIGHAYFMDDINNIAALKECFQQKIMPLLQEYFFDNWGKIKEVLANNPFIIAKGNNDDDNVTYELLPDTHDLWNKAQSYIKIYKVADTSQTSNEAESNSD